MDNQHDEALRRDTTSSNEEIDPLWHLAEDFSVTDAAALIAEYNPSIVEKCRNDTNFDHDFSRYTIAFKALKHAIINEKLQASTRYSAREYGYADQLADSEEWNANFLHRRGVTAEDDEKFSKDESCFYKPFPDWDLSTVSRDDLIRWLESRNYKTGFFFSGQIEGAEYLDPSHSRYAPKLAAAVNAWLAMDDPSIIQGKSPKQALSKWLRENASEFKLSDEEGKPNETGIEECAKVANWQDKGGAPKTPTNNPL
ncbi:MAG: hypothetical protein LPH21_17435 [Shewanella sp.]|nr:hypothetical protein [Shewanella sp.]MCG7937032.1 hypothetical protein [Candidatus Thiodiazotropha taylori]